MKYKKVLGFLNSPSNKIGIIGIGVSGKVALFAKICFPFQD